MPENPSYPQHPRDNIEQPDNGHDGLAMTGKSRCDGRNDYRNGKNSDKYPSQHIYRSGNRAAPYFFFGFG